MLQRLYLQLQPPQLVHLLLPLLPFVLLPRKLPDLLSEPEETLCLYLLCYQLILVQAYFDVAQIIRQFHPGHAGYLVQRRQTLDHVAHEVGS